MEFKEWLQIHESGNRTGAKIGLYPTISDILGQYPPLWGVVKAADMITYYDINYPNGVPSNRGIINYASDRKMGHIHPKNHPLPHHKPGIQQYPGGHHPENPVYDLPPE